MPRMSRKHKALLKELEETYEGINLRDPQERRMTEPVPEEEIDRMVEELRKAGEKSREQLVATIRGLAGAITTGVLAMNGVPSGG